MTTFPNSPAVLKGGIVLLDPTTGAVRRVIALQYNPDSISRTLTTGDRAPKATFQRRTASSFS